MKYFLSLLTFFISLNTASFSQNTIFGQTYNDQLPGNFKLSIEEEREKIYNKIPQHIREGVFDRKIYQFADESAAYAVNIMANGNVYSNWDELQEYIDAIFQKVLPKELKDEKMEVYIHKHGRFKTFTTANGKLYISVGLLGEVFDEATIAGFMAHELAHYHLGHSLKKFLKRESGGLSGGLFAEGNWRKLEHSIQNEIQADSLALEWLVQSGYHSNGLVEAFNVSDRMFRWQNLQLNGGEISPINHLPYVERWEKIVDFQKKQKAEGKYFLISKNRFVKVINEAKTEILKTLIRHHDYDYCIEQAFKYHIFDLNTPNYVYYLMEAIRKKCYLNPSAWDDDFIASAYYKVAEDDKTIENVKEEKTEENQHLFKSVPVNILRLKPSEVPNIETKFYWEDVKFTTNKEAFEFFYDISQIQGCDEAILSYALGNSYNKPIRDKHLNLYLTKENIRYRGYSEALLKGKSMSVLETHKLTVHVGFRMKVRQKKSDVNLRNIAPNGTNQVVELLENILDDDVERTLTFLATIKENSMNEYQQFMELFYFSYLPHWNTNFHKELHIFSPDYWELMKKYEVNEIEFITCSYHLYTADKKTLETYKELISKDYKTILAENNANKSFSIGQSIVRCKKDVKMSIRFIGGSETLIYREAGDIQIKNWLKYYAKQRDELLIPIDAQYINRK